MIDLFDGHIHSYQDLVTEIAYVVLCYCAWRWALSALIGVAFLWREKNLTAWRWKAAGWLLAKACFFTFVGSVWWFDWFNQNIHSAAIFALAFCHWFAYREWVKLPRATRPFERAPGYSQDELNTRP